ncbi:ABC transporter permease [Pleomorphomonas sp. NRK KF1]|uniref:ABC transporter permease n=1 Tax=Pleomorphomonas sp. NRK KF1 TaxID=2943000 RepID=UPI0020438326|nr:ABC transporter permease [Pleomorphomonas sp. NRK KF1]MCM5554324.1 ABC transporter permease [Pleomorphomonas sp. NRK KF1]
MTSVSKLLRRSETAVLAILIVVMIVIGVINPAFWQADNLFNLLRANVVIGIMALSVLTVMISGGIDVSFPAFAVAAMYLTVIAMNAMGYQGVVLPFIGATVIGLLCGLANAFFIHTFRMIPLIVTLGSASVVRGLLLGLVGTSIINIDRMPPSLIAFGSSTIEIGGSKLSLMIFIYLGIALLMWLFLTRTMAGRAIFAYGDDAESAKRVGFNTRRTVYLVYGLAGALAGFAGLLHASMIWLANPRDFVGYELDVIAAVVLGGASIFGGRGSVFGTILGVFMLTLIKNSLIIMRIDNTWQGVVVGCVIVIATALTAWRDRKALV